MTTSAKNRNNNKSSTSKPNQSQSFWKDFGEQRFCRRPKMRTIVWLHQRTKFFFSYWDLYVYWADVIDGSSRCRAKFVPSFLKFPHSCAYITIGVGSGSNNSNDKNNNGNSGSNSNGSCWIAFIISSVLSSTRLSPTNFLVGWTLSFVLFREDAVFVPPLTAMLC